MPEPAFTAHGRGVSAYVCAQCTNRFYTYAETPPSPCAVCGSDRWKSTAPASVLTATGRVEPPAVQAL